MKFILTLLLLVPMAAVAQPGSEGAEAAKRDFYRCLALQANELDDHRSDASTVAKGVLAKCDDQFSRMIDAATQDASPSAKFQARQDVLADPRLLDSAIYAVLVERSQTGPRSN